MCGIAGVFSKYDPVDEDLIRTMTNTMIHRGPDDEGYYIHPRVGLGMRRLSIIDIIGGQQPIHNEEQKIWLVFNGEIYNYVELREQLMKRGHNFYTSADTEVIVHLYEDKGVECLSQLNGMFAFALWDEEKQQLLLAVDRLGIKPLYYYDDGRAVLFASELKSMLQATWVSRDLDLNAVSLYLSLEYVPAPKTIFKNILKLQPGHYLLYDKNGAKIKKYWDVRDFTHQNFQSKQKIIYKIQELLQDSVRLRLRSDVPVGAYLSGGIDSSTIVGYASGFIPDPIATFSVGFGDDSFKELPYARIVAEKFRTDHYELVVSAKDALQELPNLVWHMDEPMADSAIVPHYLISKFAANKVKVVLSGLGGDELFAGYPRYLEKMGGRRERLFKRLPQTFKDYALLPITRILSQSFHKKMLDCHLLEQRRYLQAVSIFTPAEKRKLLNRQTSYEDDSLLNSYFDGLPTKDWVNRLLLVDIQSYLPGDILALTDRMSMAVSLEARVPFLDHRLVEYVISIPGNLKLSGKEWKIILKESVNSFMPKEILTRPKWGFNAPANAWIKKDLYQILLRILSEDSMRTRELLNPSAISSLLQQAQLSNFPIGVCNKLWSLMILEIWCRVFLDRSQCDKPSETLAQIC